MKEKETTLSVLKDIRALLKANNTFLAEKAIKKPEEHEGMILIDFPSITAEEIVKNCNNKLGSGKLLFDTSWYEKEPFYATEKCRAGKRWVSKEIIGLNKNWYECEYLVREKGEMLNFAESVYFIQEYFKKEGKYPWDLKYSWTSSRSSYGDLVDVGDCDSDGVYVGYGGPDYSDSRRGVCFSRSCVPLES